MDNTTAYIQWHADACDKMKEITRAKNSDYTGAGDDPFSNFRRCEQMGIASVEQGFLTRMTDKMARITSLTVHKKEQQVKDEAIEDTLFDLANYAILMAGYLYFEKKSRVEKELNISPPLR